MADPVDDLKDRVLAKAVENVARRKVEDASLSPAAKDAAWRKRNIKLVLGATAVVVVGISIMTLLAKLWFYAITLAVVAGVGGAGYLAIRPRLLELRAERARKELAAKQKAAASQAEQGKLQEVQRLEEQLAALKKKT